jgi:dihydroorotase
MEDRMASNHDPLTSKPRSDGEPIYDVLVKGGGFIDPASGRKGRLDVAFAGATVAAIRADIDPRLAKRVEPAAGAVVVPGLIDDHAHAADGIGEGTDADAIGLLRGATTVGDGGTCGAGTFGAFKRNLSQCRTRVLVWLNISSIGQADTRIGECLFLPLLDVEEAVATAKAHPELIVGFKARLSTYVAGGSALPVLRLLLQAGEAAGLPVMIHVGDTAEKLGTILDLLRPGDIVSHYLTSRKNGILGVQPLPDAQIIPEAFAARRRGVRFDTARGRNHMAFPVMAAAVEQGLLPDSFSTDLAKLSSADPHFSLLTVATQFMSFGVSFEECVARMTVGPAENLRRSDLGRLHEGGIGDATLLRVEEGNFIVTDVDGRTRPARQRILAVGVVRAGAFTPIPPPA